MAPSTQPIHLTPTTATSLSHTTRHEIYSALLSGPGILHIEATLTHELQRTGWLANLKQYIVQLLRSGEATTVEEIMVKVREKMDISEDGVYNLNGSGGGGGGVNGGLANGVLNGDAGVVSGVMAVNGNGVNGHDADQDIDLKVPQQAISEASRVIRKELEAVCEIATD